MKNTNDIYLKSGRIITQESNSNLADEALEDSILDTANHLIMWAMELEKEQ